MQAQTLKTWIARRISVRTRLQQACVHYLLFLMIVTPKHSFTQAARFAGLHKSVFCKLLRDHFHVAVYTLEDLSKTQAKQWAKGLKSFKGLPFHSKAYCRAHALAYQSEHDLVVDYLTNLNLEDYIGSYDPHDVIVLADSGYDNKKIENAIIKKHWNFIIALSNGGIESYKDELRQALADA